MVQTARIMLVYCFFVSLGKHKRTGMNLLFVDTETNGIAQDQSVSFKSIDNWPQIRQIAWIVYGKDGQFVSAHNYVMSAELASPPSIDNYNEGITLLDFVKNFNEVQCVPFIDKETKEDYSRLVCVDQFGIKTVVHMSNLPELHQSNAKVAKYIEQNAKNLQVVTTEKGALVLCKKDEYSFSDSPDYQPKTNLPIHKVLNLFLESLHSCDVIIGHNIAYDVNVILCELYRYGKETKELEAIQQFCTMTQSVKFCGFETNNGDRYPKLQELYSKLFHKPFENAHDAYCDIKATACCFGALFNRGILNKEDYSFLLSESMRSSIIDGYIAYIEEMKDSWIDDLPYIKDHSKPVYLDEIQIAYEKAALLAQGSLEYLERINNACFECAKELYSSNTSLGEVYSTSLFEISGHSEYKISLDEEKAKKEMEGLLDVVKNEGDNTVFSDRKLRPDPIEPPRITNYLFGDIQEMEERLKWKKDIDNLNKYGTPWPTWFDKAKNVFYIVLGIVILLLILSSLLSLI